MSQLDSVIFGKKTFSDILEEIYKNQKKREGQVTALISELKPLVNEIGDAKFNCEIPNELLTASLDFYNNL